MLVQVLWNC